MTDIPKIDPTKNVEDPEKGTKVAKTPTSEDIPNIKKIDTTKKKVDAENIEGAETGDKILMKSVGKVPLVKKRDYFAFLKKKPSSDTPQIPQSDKVSNGEGFLNTERKRRVRKFIKIFSVTLAVLIVTLVIPAINVYKNARKVYSAGMALVTSVESQDLSVMKVEIANASNALNKLEISFKYISWTKIIPFFGGYTRDGEHVINAGKAGLEAADIVLATIEPYADIIGLTGGGEETGGGGEKTTEERIDFIVSTIPDIVPKVDELSEKVATIRDEVNQIDPNRYPDRVGDFEVRSRVKRAVELVNTGATYAANAKPLLEAAPYLLGIDDERNYLVLFQNDKELRPTGGFLTAYSLAKVADGKFEPVASNDVYNLDGRYTPALDTPEPIKEYIKGPYILQDKLRLRDINWSPDFAESMEVFVNESKKVGIDDVDGIIAVDTQVLVYLLDALGPIGVPGFGNFSTEIVPECNCPQVIYELESFADVEGPIVWDPVSGEIVYSPPNSDNRKKIIGPLMNSVLANTLASPKEKLPDIFEAAFDSVIEKHVMLYILDEDVQSAVENFGIGGTITETDGDYLYINDANLGGRKSNLYITQEVEQLVEIERDGSVTKTLTVTYKNPEKFDGWLNSVYHSWVRIYVPEGSELVDLSGLDNTVDPYTELGKTVIAGHYELRPEGVVKVTVVYTLPFKVDDTYRIFLQKQPGTDKPLHSIEVEGELEELFLLTDTDLRFTI